MAPTAWDFTVGILIAHHSVFWGGIALLWAIDRLQLFQSRRIPGSKAPPAALVWSAAWDALIASVFTQPLAIRFILYPLFMKRGMSEHTPNVLVICIYVFLCFCINDTFNYITHRWLHTKWMYQNIHKKHHLFTNNNVGLTSEYNHPIEQVIATACTISAPLILGLDLTTLCVFLAFRTWEVLNEHSGNYAMFPFFDWVFGTDKHYKAFLRERVAKAAKAAEAAEAPQ